MKDHWLRIILGVLSVGLLLFVGRCVHFEHELQLNNTAKREAYCAHYCKDKGGLAYMDYKGGGKYKCLCKDEGWAGD